LAGNYVSENNKFHHVVVEHGNWKKKRIIIIIIIITFFRSWVLHTFCSVATTAASLPSLRRQI